MKSTPGKKLKYWFENFMSKGGISIFISLFVLFAVSIFLTGLIRALIIVCDPGNDFSRNFLSELWITFLQLTDPGNMAQDNSSNPAYKVIAVISAMIGVVIFSMLIAFITTTLEEILYSLRKGKSEVVEAEHTLILGWNERIFDIMRELIIANESESYACIVILSDTDKEEMDDEISKYLPNTKTTRIVTRNGSVSSINDLERVNAVGAKSVIILSDVLDASSVEESDLADTKVIKAILAMLTICQKNEVQIPLTAELLDENKRELINNMEYENVVVMDVWKIMGKLLVQTSRSSGLASVYNEILSFDGSEIYFYEADWRGEKFGELVTYFDDGIPLGFFRDKETHIRPDNETVMQEGDQVIILGSDDSAIKFAKHQVAVKTKKTIPDLAKKREKERILILGWHTISITLIEEYADYLLDDSEIDIVLDNPDEELKTKINKISKELPSVKIKIINGNPLNKEHLRKVDPFSYMNVIILAQNEKDPSDKVDADTLLILLLLRQIEKEQGADSKATKIITQILNSENQELIYQTDVDDFIISNKLITMVMAQISENQDIKGFYDEIFKEEGSEIYLKPAKFYFDSFPRKIKFIDAISAAEARDEICMGLQFIQFSQDTENNFGVVLNPSKNKEFELQEDDRLVVVSEDEQ